MKQRLSIWLWLTAAISVSVTAPEDNDIPEGERLDGAPQHSASLWTTYEIQRGSLQGLGFGGGITFVGEREAQLPNTIELSSYARTDAAIF